MSEIVSEPMSIIGRIISTVTSVPIQSEIYLPIAWALKIIAQFIEIVLAAIFLGKEIVPNMLKIAAGSADNLEKPQDYRDAAIAYIFFFLLELFLDVAFWIVLVKTKGHRVCVPVSVLMSVVFDMPIMMCGLYLMRYKGTIDWDKEALNLLLQIWYIVNIILQITAGFAEKVKYWGIIFVAPISYVIACLIYAFVIIPMSGWHWFATASDYYQDSHKYIHGNFTSIHIHNMFDFLIISGFVGQWIFNILLILTAIYFIGASSEDRRKKKNKRKNRNDTNTV